MSLSLAAAVVAQHLMKTEAAGVELAGFTHLWRLHKHLALTLWLLELEALAGLAPQAVQSVVVALFFQLLYPAALVANTAITHR
jgi:hypothetical protein